MTANNLINK